MHFLCNLLKISTIIFDDFRAKIRQTRKIARMRAVRSTEYVYIKII